MHSLKTSQLSDKEKDFFIRLAREGFEITKEELRKEIAPFLLMDTLEIFAPVGAKEITESIRQIGREVFEQMSDILDKDETFTFREGDSEEVKDSTRAFAKTAVGTGINACIKTARIICEDQLAEGFLAFDLEKNEFLKAKENVSSLMDKTLAKLEEAVRKGVEIKFVSGEEE